MPRLSKDQNKEFERVAIANPEQTDAWFQQYFPLSLPAINDRRKKLKPKVQELVQYDAQAHSKDLNETLKIRLDEDIEALRQTALKELDTAFKEKNRAAMLAWFDRAQANARLRVEISKSLNILIDNRTQTIQINEDTLGKALWAFLRSKNLLYEALLFIREAGDK